MRQSLKAGQMNSSGIDTDYFVNRAAMETQDPVDDFMNLSLSSIASPVTSSPPWIPDKNSSEQSMGGKQSTAPARKEKEIPIVSPGRIERREDYNLEHFNSPILDEFDVFHCKFDDID